MGSRLSAPGPQEKRFTAYMDSLANAAGHEDRHLPLKSYCKGLLLEGDTRGRGEGALDVRGFGVAPDGDDGFRVWP